MMNPEPHAMHRWLQQLLGDWTCESLAQMMIQDNYEKHVEIKELNSFKDLQSLYEFVIS